MKQGNRLEGLSFDKPMIYQIKIQGDLGENWSDKLGGMQVTIDRMVGNEPISTLIGKVRDQTALAGILGTLYKLHLLIISVNILKDGKN
jgi:hypothetical protein